MPSVGESGSSKKMIWAGRIVSALPILLLTFAGAVKVMKVPAVLQASAKYGFSVSLIVAVGAIELTCTLVYLIPATRVLGAILMTALLGGAVVTNLRAGDPVIFPILVGVLAWLGLYLRDARLRALIPLQK